MRSLHACLSVLTLTVLPLLAQAKIEVLGGQGTRNNTAVILADTSKGFTPLALVTITYGVPEWKPEYTDKAEEMTKGKMFRLGRDNWPIFDSNVAIKFGSVTVPAGKYVLKATRTGEEAWVLNVLTGDDKTVADVPLTKAALPGSVETFTIKLTPDAKDKKAAVLELEWGTTALRAPFKVK